MIVAGVDIGSLSGKAVIIKDNVVIAQATTATSADGAKTARTVMDKALGCLKCSIALSDIDYIVTTGYGRVEVPFSNKTITEISCHARGNHWLFPEVRTVLDIGGQDCKAIRCDSHGKVVNFAMNDKCAAGTGRYLQRVAVTLNMPLGEIGRKSLAIKEGPVVISETCAVFAQYDIVRLLREGKAVGDILAGVNQALVHQILPLLLRIGVEREFAMSGGVAYNVGVVKILEQRLGLEAKIAANPQTVGALGAALFAQEIVQGNAP